MATIRMSEDIWLKAREHLLSRGRERFAFFIAGLSYSQGEPLLNVRELRVVSEDRVNWSRGGYNVDPAEFIEAINAAIRSGGALIEAHSHGGTFPRFSETPDRPGIAEASSYVIESLPNRPYVATVWGDDTVYGEYFCLGGKTGVVRSILVGGAQFRQIVSGERQNGPGATFDRQVPWFSATGQIALGRIRVGIVGLGGTGSLVAQQLAYLGVRDFLLIDHDHADLSNLNRLVTARAVDGGMLKTTLAKRTISEIAPDSITRLVDADIQSPTAIDSLRGADVIFGCVDNDGARLVLNELAVAYEVPYFDLGVGITTAPGGVTEAGGRVAVVANHGPCLNCMQELDMSEASYHLASEPEQRVALRRGYVQDVAAPAVISLNAAIAAAAINEFATWFSGIRAPNPLTQLDLLGTLRPLRGQWLAPMRVARQANCAVCALWGEGDRANLERYARVSRKQQASN